MSNEGIPSAGSKYKVEKSTKWVKSGNHDTGTPRNEGLPLPEKEWMRTDRESELHATVPEYSEKQSGGRSKNHLKVPKSKQHAVQSNPKGANPDARPDDAHAKSTSGPRHPGKGATGSAPRHPSHKAVSSTPSAGPRQAKGKDSSDVNDSTAYGRNCGNREPVGNATVRKRSDVVPADSSMIHPDNNPKSREGNYYGISRTALKDSNLRK